MTINLIDKKIYDAPKVRESIRLASEDPVEEFELMELPILIKEFKIGKKTILAEVGDFYKIYLGNLTSERFVPPWERDSYIDPKDGVIEEEPTIKVAELPKSKINEIIKIKKKDLTPDFLKLIDTFSRMTPGQRESIDWILKRTFRRKNNGKKFSF